MRPLLLLRPAPPPHTAAVMAALAHTAVAALRSLSVWITSTTESPMGVKSEFMYGASSASPPSSCHSKKLEALPRNGAVQKPSLQRGAPRGRVQEQEPFLQRGVLSDEGAYRLGGKGWRLLGSTRV